MGEGEPKSWWQTLAGVMTGFAALITAIAGLIAAIHQARSTKDESPAPPVSTHAEPTTAESARTAAKSHIPVRTAAPPADIAPESALPGDRKPYAVTLPTPREFVLGNDDVGARFMLLAAKVAPNTPESDALTIRARMIVRGKMGANGVFTQGAFQLLTDGEPTKPEHNFADVIPPQQSRDEDVLFIIPHGLRRATLRIQYVTGRADVPLDLSP